MRYVNYENAIVENVVRSVTVELKNKHTVNPVELGILCDAVRDLAIYDDDISIDDLDRLFSIREMIWDYAMMVKQDQIRR